MTARIGAFLAGVGASVYAYINTKEGVNVNDISRHVFSRDDNQGKHQPIIIVPQNEGNKLQKYLAITLMAVGSGIFICMSKYIILCVYIV